MVKKLKCQQVKLKQAPKGLGRRLVGNWSQAS